MTTRDEIKADNLRAIRSSWFRRLYDGPAMSFEQQLAVGVASIIFAAFLALCVAHVLLPVVK